VVRNDAVQLSEERGGFFVGKVEVHGPDMGLQPALMNLVERGQDNERDLDTCRGKR
jgi:hypothetical protein